MKSELKIEKLCLSSANLNGESPLPSILPVINVQTQKSAKLDEDDEIFFDIGKIKSIYPYNQQDLYKRELKNREYQAVVLENEFLKAVFLPELGGRLWSLFDKIEKKDLLYVNDCVRFCNLALCNAWFSGGVEWNLGMIGHTPLTCSPIFTARLTASDGTPILRMYEYERLRNVTYQMDFSLPADSKMLICRMRICNLNQKTIPMYWWSNIAVPETPKSRVIVPADTTYYSYWDKIDKTSLPFRAGKDITYPVNTECSMDYFFKTNPESRKYIASLDENGYGLIQTSTARLKGRKLFVWGQGEGGHTWQKFLTDKAGDYSEIQAGLGQTQYECIPMPPLAAWEWVEGYGAMSAEVKSVHGAWNEARQEVEKRLDEIVSAQWLEQYLSSSKGDYVFKKSELIQAGGGFGALENRRRELIGDCPISEHLNFGEVAEPQKEWLYLLENGQMPCPKTGETPKSYMIGNEWESLLKNSILREPDNWYSRYHEGLFEISNANYVGALDSLNLSVKLDESCWAYYALAVCHYCMGNFTQSVECILKALKLCGSMVSLWRDGFRIMNECRHYEQIIELYCEIPKEMQQDGKLLFFLANAYARIGEIEKAEEILYKNGCLVVPDIREGETSLTSLWLYIEECKCKSQGLEFDENTVKIPAFLDYQMGSATV